MTKMLSTIVGIQTAVQAGDTIGNTAVATNFASTATLPANAFRAASRYFYVDAWGLFSTDLGPIPVHTLKIDLMSDAAVLATTGAFNTTLAGAVADPWHLHADVTCDTTGAGGTVEAQGISFWQNTIVAADIVFLPNAAAVAFNTTTAHVIQLRATWTAASVNNTITLREFIVGISGAA